MVVLLVGIHTAEATSAARSNEALEFVSVAEVADAIAYLERRPCDAVVVGAGAADVTPERLAALARPAAPVTDAVRSGAAWTGRRPDQVEKTFRSGSIREMERLMILDRLARLNQNRTRSAVSLEISVRTLRNKLRDYRSETPAGVAGEHNSG
jgi:hypothetical protein